MLLDRDSLAVCLRSEVCGVPRGRTVPETQLCGLRWWQLGLSASLESTPRPSWPGACPAWPAALCWLPALVVSGVRALTASRAGVRGFKRGAVFLCCRPAGAAEGAAGVWPSGSWFVQAASLPEPARHNVPWPLGGAACDGLTPSLGLRTPALASPIWPGSWLRKSPRKASCSHRTVPPGVQGWPQAGVWVATRDTGCARSGDLRRPGLR